MFQALSPWITWANFSSSNDAPAWPRWGGARLNNVNKSWWTGVVGTWLNNLQQCHVVFCPESSDGDCDDDSCLVVKAMILPPCDTVSWTLRVGYLHSSSSFFCHRPTFKVPTFSPGLLLSAYRLSFLLILAALPLTSLQKRLSGTGCIYQRSKIHWLLSRGCTFLK